MKNKEKFDLHTFATAAFIFIVLVGLLISVVPPKVKPEESSSPKEELSKSEIGRRVEETLRNAKYLSVVTRVFSISPPLAKGEDSFRSATPIIIKADMTKDTLEVAVFKLGHVIARFSLLDGKFTERQWLDGKNYSTEYIAPIPNGTDDLRIGSADNCFMGNHIFSWVSVPKENDLPSLAVDTAGSMRKKIEHGMREADAVENHRDCYVFLEKIFQGEEGQEGDPDAYLQERLFVDKETFLVLRWDTIYPGEHLQRIRLNDIILADASPDDVLKEAATSFE